MHKQLIKSVWLAVGCLLCIAVFQPPVFADVNGNRDRRGGGHSVAVFSIIGDRFTTVSLGRSAFSREEHVTKVAPWFMDRFVETTIKDMLRKSGKSSEAGNSGTFRFPDIGIRRERLKAGLRKVYDTSRQGLFQDGDYDLNRIVDVVSALKRRGIDTLVLVIRREVTDAIEDTRFKFKGYGMYRNTWLKKTHYLYAYFSVLVIDTADGEVRYVSDDMPGYQKINKQLWAGKMKELEQSSRYVIRDTLRRLMAEKIIVSLEDADLVRRVVSRKAVGQIRRLSRNDTVTTGDDYTQAVKRVYFAMNMQSAFERYAWDYARDRLGMLEAHEAHEAHEVPGDAALYADTIRNWTETYMNWDRVRSSLVLSYARLGLSADEINEMAALAEEREMAVPPSRADLRRLRSVWNKLADAGSLEDLDRAIERRRRAIIREAGRIRR